MLRKTGPELTVFFPRRGATSSCSLYRDDKDFWKPETKGSTLNKKKTCLQYLQPYKRRCIYLALLPQSFALFAVDVSLHAGLPPADEDEMPQGESPERHRHRAAGEDGRLIFTGDWGRRALLWSSIRRKHPYLVSTQRKMTHLWAVVALKASLGEGVW